MSEFSDRPFVAGVVTGLRAFRIDPLGRLTGVTHQDVWTPGENVGVCHASGDGDRFTRMYMQHVTLTLDEGRPGRKKGRKSAPYNYYSLERRTPKPEHHIAGVSCQCGFYAYFDGGNDYLTNGGASANSSSWQAMYITGISMGVGEPDRAPRVGAIVNGWGTVTVGSRGFRAEKAEVVALISPQSDQARHEVAFAKVRRNYPGLPVFDTEKAAVREFPLTDPEPATPETADDFWTRAAR